MPGCGLGVTLTRSVRAVTGTGGTCPSLFVLLYSVSARCALGLAHTLHLWQYRCWSPTAITTLLVRVIHAYACATRTRCGGGHAHAGPPRTWWQVWAVHPVSAGSTASRGVGSLSQSRVRTSQGGSRSVWRCLRVQSVTLVGRSYQGVGVPHAVGRQDQPTDISA